VGTILTAISNELLARSVGDGLKHPSLTLGAGLKAAAKPERLALWV
jgi:hypothetical protein